MKNKLLKGAHLSERKYREILELFCDDLTATQIADISGVSRVTINNYFRLLRNIIANHCDDKQPQVYDNPETIGEENAEESGSFSQDELPAYYGFNMHDGKIGTGWLKEIGKENINHLRNPKAVENLNSIKVFQGYHAVADCSEWQLYWLNPGADSSSVNSALSEINGFWSHTRGRLQKFRGMNRKMLYLHIKECEFRYNLRHQDMLLQLTNIINTSKTTQKLSHEKLRFA